MIESGAGHRLVESLSELPDLRGAREAFVDVETTSGDDRLDALNPWHNCRLAGVAVTVDDTPGAWYVPVGHRDGPRLPREAVADWLDALLAGATWVNHNVKYDMQAVANDLGVVHDGPAVCTVVQAKLHDTDRLSRGGYGLDVLSRDLLGEDIAEYEEELRRWLFMRKRGARNEYSKDYGRVPPPAMYQYACQDVITNRRLWRWLCARMPAELADVRQTEVELTTVLFQTERCGLRVDPAQLRVAELECIMRLLQLGSELTELVGREFNPASSDQLFDVLCNQYGLPVLGWTEEDDEGQPAGNPSFDKEAMAKYLSHPMAPPGVIERIAEYRERAFFRSLFLEQYSELGVNGRLHSTYNQMQATGRLGCSKPNAQQLNAAAKELILPDPGCALLCMDQSQIEFRIIAHFTREQRVIDAYLANPDTDFHGWVAEDAQIKRKPAKTMNFLMGYGGGKRRALRQLSADKAFVGSLLAEVDAMIADGRAPREMRNKLFEQKATHRATGVYDRYHRSLPNLKPTARLAGEVCRQRGYVFDPTGRRRHLPGPYAHKAFNTLCQGYAAGIQKMTTVSAAKAIRGTPITTVANVHDETVFHGPEELMRDPRVQATLAWTLEHPRFSSGEFLEDRPGALLVPLRVAAGVSSRHWREASKGIFHMEGDKVVWDTPEPQPIHYDPADVDRDDPLGFLK